MPHRALQEGLAAQKAGRLDEALAAYEASLQVAPNYIAAHNAGDLYVKRLAWPEALQMLDLAERLNPGQTATGVLRSLPLQRLRRLDEAERILRAILAREPDHGIARERLATCLLSQSRYSEAWPYWRSRYTRSVSLLPKSGFPEWRGEPLNGRDLIVWGEQGLGDEIQMARYIPRLREFGPGRVTVASLPPNAALFRQVGADHAVSRLDDLRLSSPHSWVLMLDLPGLLGVTRENVSGCPYLSLPPAARRGGVGVAVRGNPRNPNDRLRSLPDDTLLRAIPGALELKPEGDMLDSLALVAGLDLVITVDTAWAHLAGAAGVPCWVLLSHGGVDWRWFPAGSRRSPWYDSVRLFWQRTPGSWDGVIKEVLGRLEVSA